MKRNSQSRAAMLASACAVVVSSVACDPYSNYCNKLLSCANDNEDAYDNIDADDDYVAVCSAQMRAPERTLRANNEDECQDVANAYRDLTACKAGLSCDDLAESDLGDQCDDQVEALEDAADDADGDCQTGVTTCNAGGAPASVVALLALLGVRLRRRQR